ncbi:hypothetical protein AJ80_03102 [Polytolypa hystricis UAMH7299]|uniref:CST complex subunit Ten1 n=1 Tax=Polytolypa hystricis (strain UAMH7299) TaxID=1447883 RepID=A0A2B7YL12_POLH7|nr:hypothetical protein AJ80_03102 [Polytolypa hystricis UAMH7299]
MGMNFETPGPISTKQAFLYQIPSLPAASKIRFLGCVVKYDVSAGLLTLAHNYPLKGGGQPTSINVNVNLLLGLLKATDLQVGAWLNVLGYIRQPQDVSLEISNSTLSTPKSIYIEALMVISAGSIHVGEYERVLQDSQDAERRIARSG